MENNEKNLILNYEGLHILALGINCKCLVKVASSLYSTIATVANQCIKWCYGRINGSLQQYFP